MTNSIHSLHEAIWHYIDLWKTDPTGPWWEADLSLDIGRTLYQTFGARSSITVASKPSFLQAWPHVQFRRFGSNNYFKGDQKTVSSAPQVEHEAIQKKRGGRFPDYYYRKEESNDFEWVVELKLWSTNGNSDAGIEVKYALKGLIDDANKWRGEGTYSLAFLAINIPSSFVRLPRARYTYGPNDFARFLESEVIGSGEFNNVNNNADIVVVIKSIDEKEARLVSCLATSSLANSSSRPDGIKVTPIGP